MIVANMEMWRWEPRDMGVERIEINIPDYTLRMMDGDDLVHQARVIVGKPDTPTPIFSNAMKYILVNPIWRVPDSIVRKEFAPHLARGPDYLVDHGYKVAEIGGHMFVSQPPGEGNALGHILFMFPNEHSVYLHDTPSRGLFGTARRAYSHGCVRLDQPMQLAELVMGGAAGRAPAGDGRLDRTDRDAAAPDPDPPRIFHRVRRRDRRAAGTRRHLWHRRPRRSHNRQNKSRLKSVSTGDYRGRSFVLRALCLLRHSGFAARAIAI